MCFSLESLMLIEDILVKRTWKLPEPLVFKDKYIDNGLLSNFTRGNPIEYWGLMYRTVEAAYVASKNPHCCVNHNNARSKFFYQVVHDYEQKNGLRGLKKLGQSPERGGLIELREDFDHIKVALMFDFIAKKTIGNKDMVLWLLQQTDLTLVETNNWGDATWGATWSKGKDYSVGYNVLGGLYFVLRQYLLRNIPVPKVDSVEHELRSLQSLLLKQIEENRDHLPQLMVTGSKL